MRALASSWSARVAVSIAKEFPEVQVTGVDIWTKMSSVFGLTKAGAEKNAIIANVADRCTFQYGNALDLLFEEGEFPLVVSAFTFHGIRVPDRTVLLEEAIRVLAPGGTFMICDLFPREYKVKDVPELLEKVEQLGVEDVQLKTFKEAGMDMVAELGRSRGAILNRAAEKRWHRPPSAKWKKSEVTWEVQDFKLSQAEPYAT
jgi:ubiquinone/menaquinone biosynthesis C-methylase UbiE